MPQDDNEKKIPRNDAAKNADTLVCGDLYEVIGMSGRLNVRDIFHARTKRRMRGFNANGKTGKFQKSFAREYMD